MLDVIRKLFDKNRKVTLICPKCSYKLKLPNITDSVIVPKCPKCGTNMEIKDGNILF